MTNGAERPARLYKMDYSRLLKPLVALRLITREEFEAFLLQRMHCEHLCGNGHLGCWNPPHLAFCDTNTNLSYEDCHKAKSPFLGRNGTCSSAEHFNIPCLRDISSLRWKEITLERFKNFSSVVVRSIPAYIWKLSKVVNTGSSTTICSVKRCFEEPDASRKPTQHPVLCVPCQTNPFCPTCLERHPLEQFKYTLNKDKYPGTCYSYIELEKEKKKGPKKPRVAGKKFCVCIQNIYLGMDILVVFSVGTAIPF